MVLLCRFQQVSLLFLCSLFISLMSIQCYVMFNKLLLNLNRFKVAPRSIRCKWNSILNRFTQIPLTPDGSWDKFKPTQFYSKLWTSTESCSYLVRPQKNKETNVVKIYVLFQIKHCLCAGFKKSLVRGNLTTDVFSPHRNDLILQ